MLTQVTEQFPSIAEHPLIETVQRIVAARTMRTFAVLENRRGRIDAHRDRWMRCSPRPRGSRRRFSARTGGDAIQHPQRRDFTDLTASEIQHRWPEWRRGKDLVGFAVITPSPYIDLTVLTRDSRAAGGDPQSIRDQLPMVLNLLKSASREQIQSILAKSFAQFQLNQRTAVLETKLDSLRAEMEPFGPCLLGLDYAVAGVRTGAETQEALEPVHQAGIARCCGARLHFLTPGASWVVTRGRGSSCANTGAKGQHAPMVTLLREAAH